VIRPKNEPTPRSVSKPGLLFGHSGPGIGARPKRGEGCRLTGPSPQDTRAKTSIVRPPTHPDLEGCHGIGRWKASRAAGLVPSAMVPRRRRRGAPPGRRLFVRRARPRRRLRRGAAPHDPQGARLSAPGLRLPRLPSRLAADDRIPHSLLPLRVLRRIGSLARFPKPVGRPLSARVGSEKISRGSDWVTANNPGCGVARAVGGVPVASSRSLHQPKKNLNVRAEND